MHITRRQGEIIELAAGGLTDKEIAHGLGLSVATVRTHLQRLYRANGFRNRSDAIVHWMSLRSDHPS
jgi:DNA-binding CsgD family transcriptional regulator